MPKSFSPYTAGPAIRETRCFQGRIGMWITCQLASPGGRIILTHLPIPPRVRRPSSA
jgi:hypothetical protein